MYFVKSFKTISKEHEINPKDYDEAMVNMDAQLW